MRKIPVFCSLTIFTSILLFIGCGKDASSSSKNAFGASTPESQPATIRFSEDPNQIVAQVDDTPLTFADMEKRAKGFLKDAVQTEHLLIPSNKMDEAMEFFRKRSIRTFVFKTVLMNEAIRQKIQITPADRANSLQTLAATMRRRNWTTNDFFNKGPLDPETMHKEFEDGVVIEKLWNVTVRSKLKISQEEIEYGIREIARTNEFAVQKLEKIRKQILDGADFAEVARNVSQCQSRSKGGDLGEISRGLLPKAVEDQAFKLAVGEISPVIHSTMGFQILKVTEKIPAKEKTENSPASPEKIRLSQILLREVPINRKRIMDTIQQVKLENAKKEFYKSLLKKASVECMIYPEMNAEFSAKKE